MNVNTVKTKNNAVNLSLSNNKEIYYPTEEKKKLGETDYQHLQISMLEQMLQTFLLNRTDVYLASDLILYYEEGNVNKRVAPDLMICFGVENKLRRNYKLWEEKVVPQVVIEVASRETWQKDVTTKRRLYEKLGVQEYYVIDPEYLYLPTPLMAYRLEFGELVRQAIYDNKVFSPALNLELVDTGKDFRLFDSKANKFLPTLLEVLAELESLKAKVDE